MFDNSRKHLTCFEKGYGGFQQSSLDEVVLAMEVGFNSMVFVCVVEVESKPQVVIELGTFPNLSWVEKMAV